MNGCVLDTSVLSLMYKNRPEFIPYQKFQGTKVGFISFHSIAEMRSGALYNNWGIRKRMELEAFFRRFELVEYTSELADSWAEISSYAKRVGRRLEAGDAWVAATAQLLEIPLLTHDKDFDSMSCPSITMVRFP